MQDQKQALFDFARAQFGTEPEYLFRTSPETAVLRYSGNKKWYAIFMCVSRDRLGLRGGDKTDIINVKCDSLMLGSLLMQAGFLPAYHMNKAGWVTILLDGTVETAQICAALQMSYTLIAQKQSKTRTVPKAWLIPANPKFADLEQEFAAQPVIHWTQHNRFIVGDTVYIYEGKPIGEIRYACEVVAVDVPFHYDSGGLRMEKAMQIELKQRYAHGALPLELMKDYGVTGVRGARSIPADLLEVIQHAPVM